MYAFQKRLLIFFSADVILGPDFSVKIKLSGFLLYLYIPITSSCHEHVVTEVKALGYMILQAAFPLFATWTDLKKSSCNKWKLNGWNSG